jgi:hypothetical protein
LGAECVLMHASSNNSSNSNRSNTRSQMSDRTSYLTNRSLRSRCESSGDE